MAGAALSSANVISLLSDFGLRDTYVGQMKAAVVAVNPAARLIDLTHEIGSGDVREAAFTLEGAWRHFPLGTVHLAVVDPGVGSARLPLAVAAGGHFFVGPDNGLFTLVLATHPEARLFRLREDFKDEVSATFHGRDVFAPAAGYLSLGRPLEELGEPLAACVRLALPEVRREGGMLWGEVWRVDRFGNLITNLRREHLGGRPVAAVAAGGWRGPLRRTYAEAAPGGCLALWGSAGWLEVACRGASAAERLGLASGAPVGVEMA